jgi:hypothetical protein
MQYFGRPCIQCEFVLLFYLKTQVAVMFLSPHHLAAGRVSRCWAVSEINSSSQLSINYPILSRVPVQITPTRLGRRGRDVEASGLFHGLSRPDRIQHRKLELQ